MDQPVNPKGPSKSKIDKYEVESAVRTLLEAEKIKANKELMKLVAPEIEKQHKAMTKISSIAQLRARANKMSDDDDVDDEPEAG